MMSYDYPHPVSRTYQYKKITKPLLERKRRARINRCLDELKDLMVDALETEGEDISKLEKADILELTVRHLQRLQSSRSSGSAGVPVKNESASDESRWLSGFGHCASEACRFLSALPGEAAERLARHLAAGLQSNRQTNSSPKPSLISSTLNNLERTANLVAACSTVDISGRHTPLETARSCTERSAIQFADSGSEDNSIVSEKEKTNDGGSSETDSRDRRRFAIRAKSSALSAIKAEDDEEIDVERVDEVDPMWRPW